jgi:hypothetical protein
MRNRKADMIDGKKEDSGKARPPQGRGGVDPRLLGLIGVVIVIGLAVLLAYLMNSLNHADACLATGGVGCG